MKHAELMALGAAVLLVAGMAGQAIAKPVKLVATLGGAAETAGGDPDGVGGFKADVDDETGDFCFTLWADKTTKPTMAHVHAGAAGTNGAPVITLDVTGKGSDMCIAVEPDKLKPIVADPAGFYINIHTADFPAGAVRGQLAKG